MLIGNKPLPEPMLTQMFCHMVSLGNIELKQQSDLFIIDPILLAQSMDEVDFILQNDLALSIYTYLGIIRWLITLPDLEWIELNE